MKDEPISLMPNYAMIVLPISIFAGSFGGAMVAYYQANEIKAANQELCQKAKQSQPPLAKTNVKFDSKIKSCAPN